MDLTPRQSGGVGDDEDVRGGRKRDALIALVEKVWNYSM
jgi:hypothetical protein